MPMTRVKFVIDEDAQFEECNGEQRPLTEDEYRENGYRACPLHPRAGTKTIDASVSPTVAGCRVCGNTHYEDIPYAEYLAYYGNPERHVYVGYIVQDQCRHCQQWHDTDSLWSIDLMDDAEELSSVTFGKWIPMRDALTLPGYFGELMRELQP